MLRRHPLYIHKLCPTSVAAVLVVTAGSVFSAPGPGIARQESETPDT